MSLDESLQEAPDNSLLLRLEGTSTLGLSADPSGATFDDSCRLWFDVKCKGVRVALLESTLAEIGYRSGTIETSDFDFRLPPYIARSLQKLFPPAVDPVWLILTEPRGPLPSVPWEALLSPWIGAPLVRYSTNNLSAERFEQTRDSVVCFCCGADDSLEDRTAVVQLYLGMLPEQMGEAQIHVFADASTRKLLDRTRPQFLIHEPPEHWARLEPSQRDVTHPWLRWVHDEMRGKTVNFVHIICDGALGSQEGGLSFISPISAEIGGANYPVGAREINMFLDRLGTWCVGFSSPPTNQSVAGLRYLHDQLGEGRSGPVLLHDMNRDFDGTALMAAYRYYLRGGRATRSGAISLYWNPSRDKFMSERERELSELTPVTRLRQLGGNAAGAPVWISSAQRTFEASLTALRKEPNSETERQIQEGIKAALRYASQAIAESAESAIRLAASPPEEHADASN